MAEKKTRRDDEPPAELQPGQRLADGELRARGIDPQGEALSQEELLAVPASRPLKEDKPDG